MIFLAKYWMQVSLLLVGLVGGYKLNDYLTPPPSVAEVPVKSNTNKEVLKKKTKNTVKKEPDGTVTTTSEVSTTDSTTIVKVNPYHPSQYSLDVTTNPLDYTNYKVGVGVRLGNLPLHGVIEYEPKEKTGRVGIRAEF